MYQFLLVFHIISFCVLLVASYLVFKQRYLSNWKNLVLTGGLCICYSLGYLLEVCTTTLEEAKICLDMEYLGLAFLPAVFFFFVSDFCYHKINEIVKIALVLLGVFIVCLVIMCEYTPLYYSSVEFAYDGLFPHVVLGHGIFYNVYIVVEFVLFIYAAVLIWLKRSKETNGKKRYLLTYLFVVSLLPMIAVVINLVDVFKEYDVGPLSCTVMLSMTIILMLDKSMTDVVSLSLMNLYATLGNGIVILDNEGKYLDCNPAALCIFPELEACKVGTFVEEIAIDIFNQSGEQYFQKDNVYYSGTSTKLYNKGFHVGYLIAIDDVTKMHNQIDEMAALKSAADAASEAKSKFLTTMSHEIRTPLNAIIGMSTLSEMESDPEVIRSNSHQIKAAGEMLLDIVSEVLDISKAESGKLEIVPVEYDFKELLEGVINITNMRIGDKPIRFIVDIDPSIPKNLIGDNVRIRQILVNYLSNAEKYTDKGSITLKIDGARKGDEVILHCLVTDTGRGIKESDLDVLFTPFTQVDAKKNHMILGTGLGLSIVDRLLTLMGGTHEVESVYGEGSTFGFTLSQTVRNDEPLITDAARQAIEVTKFTSFELYSDSDKKKSAQKSTDEAKGNESDKTDISATKPQFPDKRVLIVDDNKVNLTVLASFLKQFGIAATKCSSGQEAIDRFTDNEYDIVFMDHMMPEMDGVEAVKRIRALDGENPKNVIIVACTANVVSSALEEFEKAGMDDFLSKPIIFEQLQEMLEKYWS